MKKIEYIIAAVIVIGFVFMYTSYRINTSNQTVSVTSTSTVATTTTEVDTSDWQIIKSDNPSFEFSYPNNIFTENNVGINSILYSFGKRGRMAVYKFEPSEYERIWNYPEIKSAKKVKIGNSYGYESKWAEGGNFATIFWVSTNNQYTINIRFDSDENSIYPIADDIDLQNQILSTFKFSTN